MDISAPASPPSPSRGGPSLDLVQLLMTNAILTAACVSLLAALATAGFYLQQRHRYRERTFRVQLAFAIASLVAALYLGATFVVRLGYLVDSYTWAPAAYRAALASAVLIGPAFILFHELLENPRSRHGSTTVLTGTCAVLALLAVVPVPWGVLESDSIRVSGENVLGDYGPAAYVYFPVIVLSQLVLAWRVFRLMRLNRRDPLWLIHGAAALMIIVAPSVDVLRELDITLAPAPVAWTGFTFVNMTSFMLLMSNYGRLVGEVRSRTRKLRRVSEEARRDPLTGLYTRSALEELAGRALEEDPRGQAQPAGLLLVDLDDFKALNDRHGHAFGDRVLREVSRMIAANMRDNDIAGRWGGDEFVVFLRDAPPVAARQVMERLRSVVAEHRFGAAGEPGDVTVSMGFADVSPGRSWDDVFELADRALYESKQAGKNRITMRAAG